MTEIYLLKALHFTPEMNLFGSSSGDTSSSYSNNDEFASKLRSPSSELDFSDNSGMSSLGGAGASDDIQTRIQIETQKAELVGQVITMALILAL